MHDLVVLQIDVGTGLQTEQGVHMWVIFVLMMSWTTA